MSKPSKGEPTRDAGTDVTHLVRGGGAAPSPVQVTLPEVSPPDHPVEQTILLPRTPLPSAENVAPLDYSPTAPTLPLSRAQTGADPGAVEQRSTASESVAKKGVEAGGRFRLLRPWREGGLGKVSIALDEELHREVALKEIKSRHAANKQSQDRFLLEAEITGSLEHPGIVPVYGMGRYHDGRPYYAMRFVHGDSLEEAIHRYHRADKAAPRDPGERTVEFRELLNRFIAVCNAIAYAHSRGVLHRDLKPGNILLAKYGETLVVDWGLAKVAGQTDQIALSSGEAPLELQAGSDTASTRLGSVIGTPGYMSPEQAQGRLDLLGPPSDIYSLGATLYCVLTGVNPFTALTLDSLLDNVKRGEFPPPRSIDPQIPRPLEAICLKAMSLQPDDRYPTASALADDLAHWLADEPVSAFPERPMQRAARWVRRHRDAAMITAVGVALLAIVSVVAAVLVNHQRMIAAKLADDNYRLAEQERAAKDQAEIAFREARDAVDDLFTKVSDDSLLNQPGMQPVRKDLLQKTLDYYERFLKQRADDPSVKEEYAATLFKAGRILDELQSPEKATPYLERARDLQAELLSESPNDRNRLQALGETQNALGRSLHRSQQFDAAKTAYEKARDLRQQLATKYPNDRDVRRQLANSIMNIGLVERDSDDPQAAAKQLDAAQTIRKELLATGEASPKLQRDLAMGAYNQGLLEAKHRHADQAVKFFSEAIDRFHQLVAQDPRDLNLQRFLAVCYRKVADVQANPDAPGESLRFYESARDQFSKLADRNPDVTEFQSDLAGVYLNLARVQEKQDPTAALTNADKSRSILADLVNQYPSDPQFRYSLAVSLGSLSILQFTAKQRDAAQDNMRAAIEYLKKLVEEYPDNQEYQEELKAIRQRWEEQLSDSSNVNAA